MNQMRDDVLVALRNDLKRELEKCLQSINND